MDQSLAFAVVEDDVFGPQSDELAEGQDPFAAEALA